MGLYCGGYRGGFGGFWGGVFGGGCGVLCGGFKSVWNLFYFDGWILDLFYISNY